MSVINYASTARDCIRTRLPSSWSLSFADPSLVPITASRKASELGLKGRGHDYREQEFIEISVSTFQSYRVIDPQRIETMLSEGLMEPISNFADLAASSYAPFNLYKIGGTTLFLSQKGGVYCELRYTPVEWPNPFAICQTVRGSLSATSRFSAEALAQLGQVVNAMDEVTRSVSDCMVLKGR